MKLAGRHALITGGSSGIGLAIAKELARAGCHVQIAARRRELLDQAISAIQTERANESQEFGAHICDVASRRDVAALFDRLRAAGKAPSCVVNSAGVRCAGYFQKIPVEDFERTMQINFLGTLYVTKEAVADMLAAGEGWVLNIASVAGLMGVFGISPYCASKFAVCGFTQTIRSEMKRHGICVSLLCPPDTDTPMLEADADNPPETRALAKSGGVLTPERVALEAIRGMLRNRAVIIPGIGANVVSLAHRWAPDLVEWVGDWIIRRAVPR